MATSRPELTGPADLFYDEREARKYTSSSRVEYVQREISERCIELLNIPPGQRRLILDVGCGSGLSGAALEASGHEWIGCDISRDMLQIAAERLVKTDDASASEEEDEAVSEMHEEDEEEDSEGLEEDSEDEEMEDGSLGMSSSNKRRRVAAKSAELIQHDMGLGLPFRDGTFDGAISVSAIQWLCYDNSSQQSAHKRLGRFFGSLYSILKRGSRAALQFYPQNDKQATLIATAAARAGFAGGIVVDFPNSSKAKKYYLCLSMDRSYRKPEGKTDDDDQKNAARRKSKHRKPKKDRDWVLQKKAHQRRLGLAVRPDTKFTGRKRKDRF